MKKLATLFVFMTLLLFFGSQSLTAGTDHVANYCSYHIEKKESVKLADQKTGTTLIEEANLDIEEFGGDIKDSAPTKIFTGNYSLLDHWYLAILGQSVLNQYQKNFKIFAPFCGQSNPIYITHRVLRI